VTGIGDLHAATQSSSRAPPAYRLTPVQPFVLPHNPFDGGKSHRSLLSQLSLAFLLASDIILRPHAPSWHLFLSFRYFLCSFSFSPVVQIAAVEVDLHIEGHIPIGEESAILGRSLQAPDGTLGFARP
jgi:hypothetical protein